MAFIVYSQLGNYFQASHEIVGWKVTISRDLLVGFRSWSTDTNYFFLPVLYVKYTGWI